MSRAYEEELGRQVGRYVEAPADWIREDGYPNKAIYLAGATVGADWQEQMRRMFGQGQDWYAIINPRRSRGAWADGAERAAWEAEYIKIAYRLAFWFPADGAGSDLPAAMQLVEALATPKRMAVGIDTAHPDREAIRETVYRLRNEVEVVDSLAGLYRATLDAQPRPARAPKRLRR